MLDKPSMGSLGWFTDPWLAFSAVVGRVVLTLKSA